MYLSWLGLLGVVGTSLAMTGPPSVRNSEAIARYLGFEPTLRNSGSSNMNYPIGRGTPAIGLGGQRGGRRAYPDEWADIPSMIATAKHVVLLAATMGGAGSVHSR